MTHSPLPPFAALAGSRTPRILFVAESWGEHEAETRRPLVGESGKEFWRMLGEAWPGVAPQSHAEASALHKFGPIAWVKKREEWMESARIAMTNVFALRPIANKLETLCVSKKELEAKLNGQPYEWPHVSQGSYISPEYLGELARLDLEIDALRPNLIVALGNTASWALCRETNIGSIRGTIRESRSIAGRKYKILPTYHPAGVLRQWAWRPIVVTDLMKAWREGQSPDFARPKREILIKPSIEEVEAWVDDFMRAPPALVSCDTETSRGQITMIGFGRSRAEAILIPFSNMRPPWNYWEREEDELRARVAAQRILESDVPKLFQNGMYDFQYLRREGFALRACDEDSMLLHHSILPEMKKGLGFLGSVYTSEPAWKLMRLVKADTEKRDE